MREHSSKACTKTTELVDRFCNVLSLIITQIDRHQEVP
jgi:hypothetical protein